MRARRVHTLFRRGHPCARHSDPGLCRGELALRSRRRDGYLRLADAQCGGRFRQIGAGAIQGHLIVSGVQFDQHRAGLNVLIVVHQDLDYGAANTRAHGMNVPVDLRVIRGFAHREVAPCQNAAHHQHDDHAERQQLRQRRTPECAPAAVRAGSCIVLRLPEWIFVCH